MGFSYCTDISAADWLVRSETPWEQLVTLGPAGYQAYARLRFIPDPSWPNQAEAEVEVPEGWPSDLYQARCALGRLAPFTGTPQECYFCVWEGWPAPFLPSDLPPGPLVTVPHRRYALFKARLTDIANWENDFGRGQPCPPPAFVWPADHRWCFTSDVDPHWAGIGAEQAAIDSLVNDPDLDVVQAQPDSAPPAYR